MNSEGRLLGLDYGSATVGVAVTDPFRVTVREVEIIRRETENHLRKTVRRICELKDTFGAEAVILGCPVNMDGSFGERAEKTKEFGELLKRRLGVPVILHDERLTTVEAEEIMRSRGIDRRDFPKYVDMVAAAVILSDYLNHTARDR